MTLQQLLDECKNDINSEIAFQEIMAKHDKQIRAEVIDEVRKICGTENPSYTKCAYCLFATFKDDFDTTICKIEQLKENK